MLLHRLLGREIQDPVPIEVQVMFKTKKLDSRYSGHEYFKHLVEFKPKYQGPTLSERREMFCNVREWCWTTWGASAELLMYATSFPRSIDPRWSWDTEHGHLRIYLKGDEELSWFLLKWL
jgi:hypothetical protein